MPKQKNERNGTMKEKLLDAGSCLLAVVLSIIALAAVAELSVHEIPPYGEIQY
jgi:hypothetical protein